MSKISLLATVYLDHPNTLYVMQNRSILTNDSSRNSSTFQIFNSINFLVVIFTSHRRTRLP